MTGFDLALICLSLNVWHESRSESLAGQYAVAFVTINRAKESHADICDVVFKDKQFSWANHALDNHGKLLPKYMPHGVEWQTARTIARNTISNIHLDFTGGATYYYADYIAKPSWAKNMIQTAHYGHHIFYREVR